MNIRNLSLAAVAAYALAAPAFAHHSFSMFDAEKTVTMEGTVKEFEWTNPHSWIRVMVQNAAGRPLEWAVEMGSPSQIAQRGWSATSVKPGDKITLTIHPLKDGSRGGQFMAAVLPNGQKLANPGRPTE